MTKNRCRRRVCSICVLALLNIVLTIKLLQQPECPPVEKAGELKHLPHPAAPPPFLGLERSVAGTGEGGFNISFELGHWDRQRMFKTFYFITVGSNFTHLSQLYSVTLATQSSLDKLFSIVQVALQWSGPISVAVYAAGDEEYYLLYVYITFLQECFAGVRARVVFHLTVPKDKMPTGKIPANLKHMTRATMDCRRPEAVLKQLLKARSQGIIKWRLKAAYPQNHLRNTARKTAQTHFVFLTDVDVVPSSGMAERLDFFMKSPKRECDGNCAYVIPTYELDDRASFPFSKKELIRLSKKGLARPFHQKVFIYNQFATNFTRWETFHDPDEDVVMASHAVTNFEFLYEPFYVAADIVPEHDERFIGYGYTRNTQVYEMYVAGYKFFVLSPIFTIHWGLQLKKGRPTWRERQNTNNRKLFDSFKKEVFAKYHKDPLNMLH